MWRTTGCWTDAAAGRRCRPQQTDPAPVGRATRGAVAGRKLHGAGRFRLPDRDALGRSHQRLNGQKGPLPQDGAQYDGPQQIFCRDLVAAAPITGGAEVSGQVQMLADVLPQAAWGGALQWCFLFFFFRCWRAKTKSWALAASTSRTAS